MINLLLHQDSNGKFSEFRLNQRDLHPLERKAKKQKTENRPQSEFFIKSLELKICN